MIFDGKIELSTGISLVPLRISERAKSVVEVHIDDGCSLKIQCQILNEKECVHLYPRYTLRDNFAAIGCRRRAYQKGSAIRPRMSQ